MPRTNRNRALAGLGVLAIAATGAAFGGCGDNDVDDAIDNAQEQIDEAAENAQEQADEIQSDIEDQIDEATGDQTTTVTETESSSSDY
jgi:hypothetical protein